MRTFITILAAGFEPARAGCGHNIEQRAVAGAGVGAVVDKASDADKDRK